jgi:hypothetical protein
MVHHASHLHSDIGADFEHHSGKARSLHACALVTAWLVHVVVTCTVAANMRRPPMPLHTFMMHPCMLFSLNVPDTHCKFFGMGKCSQEPLRTSLYSPYISRLLLTSLLCTVTAHLLSRIM